MSTETPQRLEPDAHSVGPLGLTRFQIDLLVASCHFENKAVMPTGPRIRRYLEAYHDREITHGQLYPNLDSVAERGLLSVTQHPESRRTKRYDLTDQGRQYLVARAAFVAGEFHA